MRVCVSAALVAVAALAATTCAVAQTFPSRPIRIVVPWPAGGPPDAIGRLLGQRVSEGLKQQVVVDNRAGANSIIGSELVAKSPADGYTYLLTTGSHTTNAALYSKLPYDTLKDFAALTLVVETAGMVLGVHPSVPAKSVKELVALARTKPGALTFGSAGNGNTLHLAGELFKVATGANLTHVPYKGAAPALTDLLGGHIDMMFASPVSMAPAIQSGRLRGLVQMGAKRAPLLPELPTMDELGYRGTQINGWYGFYAPARTPRENSDRVVAEIWKGLKEATVVEKLRALGAEPVGMPPEEFARYLTADIDRYAKLGKRIGLKLD